MNERIAIAAPYDPFKPCDKPSLYRLRQRCPRESLLSDETLSGVLQKFDGDLDQSAEFIVSILCPPPEDPVELRKRFIHLQSLMVQVCKSITKPRLERAPLNDYHQKGGSVFCLHLESAMESTVPPAADAEMQMYMHFCQLPWNQINQFFYWS